MIAHPSNSPVPRRTARRSSLLTAALLLSIIAMAAITFAAVRAAALRVVIIGDSTAYTYSASDSLRGWGQELGFFFTKGAVTVINKSIGGRSSRSFVEDGHWASVKDILKKGDILLISFGTNDRGTVPERHADTAQFRQFLTQYVTESRALGAVPVLLSTVNQNSWSGTTFVRGFTTGANDYRGAMLRVATALIVPFIDLEQKSADLFKSLGQSYLANFIFIAGNTHFQEMGAVVIAKLVAQGIQELSKDPDVGALSAALAQQYSVTVTANKAGAGMITASGAYPPGAPITLKVMPNSGQTFQEWRSDSGKTLSTQKLYAFTMKASACAYGAVFKGGTGVVRSAEHTSPVQRSPSITLSGNGKVSVISDAEIIGVRITDVSGKCLFSFEPKRRHASFTVGLLPHGTYVVSARTATGITSRPMQR